MFKSSFKFKTLVSLSTALVFLFSSIAPAAQEAMKSAAMTDSEKTRLTQDKALLEKMGYVVSVDYANKKAVVYDKSSNIAVMEFPFADESKLRKFSPKSLNAMILEEMRKVNAANGSAFSESLKHLPAESAIFFVAMGAVVAGQLITNYSQNPMAMQQHVEHSLSPVGIFGFYTFMYSQGVTSNVLAMYMKNPKFHHMIPYLGMTVGAFVQSYLSQVASDPNVMACAKTMMGGKVSDKDLQAGVDKDPCSKAYEYLVLKKKLWEFAPGMVSMLASSALAGVVQSVATKAILRVTGFDVALFLLPGGMEVKGIRLLLVKGLQIALFVAIDQWMNRQVTYAWKNVFDGRELGSIGTDVQNNVNALKKSNWQGSDKDLQANLKLFREKMSAWRMMNLAEVYEAHQNWTTALQRLTSMYNASYSFYGDFISQVRAERLGKTYAKPLERLTPFYGIKMELSQDQQDYLLTEPAFIEGKQYETISAVAQQADAILKSANFAHFFPREKDALTKIITGLHTQDMQALSDSLVLLNSELRATAQNISASQGYYQTLWSIYAGLGTPSPMMEKGRGWVTYYGEAPATSERLKGTDYYRAVGLFSTPKITDYLVMQMICGPDVEHGEKAIRNSVGYPSVFMPPTIRNEDDEFDACDGIKADAGVARIYNWPVKAAGGSYDGFVSYLAAQARGSAVGDAQASSFDTWWKKNTESQMQAAFANYGKSYEEIIIKMIRGIYRPGRSSLNRGPIYNGTMNAAFQEERVYLSLLNDLINPSAQYAIDLENNMTKAPTQALLKEVETQFSILNGLVKKLQVVKIDGEERVQSPIENYQFEDQFKNVQTALAKVSAALGVGDDSSKALVTVNTAQRNMAVTALESLQGLGSEIMMYGMMANAVSWDKINNLKQVNIEQQKFNNEFQKKIAQMRGMTMPGKN